jgi:predicted permease
MSLRAWWMRARGLFTGGRRAARFDAELNSHLHLHIEDLVARGLAPDEARRQALIALGGVQAAREAYRDRGGLPSVDSLLQDIRFAARLLRKSPGFTLTAVLILGLGIGANTAVFTIINAVMLRPLNGGSLERPLVGLYSADHSRRDRYRAFSYPEYVDIRERSSVFTHLIAEASMRTGITEAGQTRRIDATLVSSNFFAAQNVPMVKGRAFLSAEEHPLADAAVAIVSYAFWRRHGLAPTLVGQPIILNGRPFTVVGIAPEWFQGTMPVMSSDVWVPFGAARLLASADQRGFFVPASMDRSAPALLLAGSLAPGLSLADAEARLQPLARAFAAAYPEFNATQQLIVHERSRTARGTRPRTDTESLAGAGLVMAIASLVLFVACLNLANMLLARSGARRQEIAVRLALGCSRGRLVRQLLVEGLLLSAAAGAAALLFSWLGARQFVEAMRGVSDIAIAIDVSPDVRVVTVVVAAAVISTLIFSLGPAWRLSRPELSAAMKPSSPLADGTRLSWLPGTMVAAQIAVSVTLLVWAGVFVRVGARAASADPGFPLEGRMIAQVDPRLVGYDATRGRVAMRSVLARLRETPGVVDASFASIVPFGTEGEGRLMRAGGSEAAPVFSRSVVIGSRYFSTVGLPIVAGRDFSASEEVGTDAAVAMLDDLLAERLFGPNTNPVGRIVHLVDPEGGVEDSLEVIGVVPSIRDDVTEGPVSHLYVPFGRTFRMDMTFHVRVDPLSEARMLDAMRQAIRAVDDRLPIQLLRTMTAHRDNSSALVWTIAGTATFAAFGVIGLALSTAGVYGLRAYLVSRRTREIGLRVALGASRQQIVRQLLRDGAWIAVAGIVAGAGMAAALIRVLQQSGELDEVNGLDPLVYGAAALALGLTTTLASYLPARRALRIDPAIALRPE